MHDSPEFRIAISLAHIRARGLEPVRLGKELRGVVEAALVETQESQSSKSFGIGGGGGEYLLKPRFCFRKFVLIEQRVGESQQCSLIRWLQRQSFLVGLDGAG